MTEIYHSRDTDKFGRTLVHYEIMQHEIEIKGMSTFLIYSVSLLWFLNESWISNY